MPLSNDLLDRLLTEADGQDLFGQEGLLSELTTRLAERALEAELTHHLGYPKLAPDGRRSGNSRNGHTPKTVQTEHGPVTINVPRDRNADFEPQIVPKHQRRLAGFDEKVIALYARAGSERALDPGAPARTLSGRRLAHAHLDGHRCRARRCTRLAEQAARSHLPHRLSRCALHQGAPPRRHPQMRCLHRHRRQHRRHPLGTRALDGRAREGLVLAQRADRAGQPGCE